MEPEVISSNRLLSLYGAVAEDEGLEPVLEELRLNLDLVGCALLRCSASGKLVEIVSAAGYDEILRRRLPAVLTDRLVFLVDGQWFGLSDRIWLDHDLDGERRVCDSDYFRHWLVPQGVSRVAYGLIDRSDVDGSMVVLELAGGGQFFFDEKRIVAQSTTLLPHLRQALILRRRLCGIEMGVEMSAVTGPWDRDQPVRPDGIRPDLEGMPPEMRLRALYHLTQKEIQVALLLAQGLDARTIAGRTGVSVSTVRSHLTSIRGKTDTLRQGELIHLLLTGPAALSREIDGGAFDLSA